MPWNISSLFFYDFSTLIDANSYILYEFYMMYFDDKLLEISELDEIDKW